MFLTKSGTRFFLSTKRHQLCHTITSCTFRSKKIILHTSTHFYMVASGCRGGVVVVCWTCFVFEMSKINSQYVSKYFFCFCTFYVVPHDKKRLCFFFCRLYEKINNDTRRSRSTGVPSPSRGWGRVHLLQRRRRRRGRERSRSCTHAPNRDAYSTFSKG